MTEAANTGAVVGALAEWGEFGSSILQSGASSGLSYAIDVRNVP